LSVGRFFCPSGVFSAFLTVQDHDKAPAFFHSEKPPEPKRRSLSFFYTRGYLSYKKILSRGKHLAVREVFSNTRQKAGGKHRRLRGANMRSSSIVMRDEGFEGG
jgi:hypothetical protein